MTIHHEGQALTLDARKALFWHERSTLLLADLHLGKGSHFNRAGLAVPVGVQVDNFSRLQELLEEYSPERVLFLGDLFHSVLNDTVETFAVFLSTHPEVSFELVLGNHDILPDALYDNSILTVHRPPYEDPPFVHTHYPLPEPHPELYNFYGHIHPGVQLAGAGREVIKLPCFHFAHRQAALPAFGAFTGLAIVRPGPLDRTFVIAEGEVLEVG